MQDVLVSLTLSVHIVIGSSLQDVLVPLTLSVHIGSSLPSHLHYLSTHWFLPTMQDVLVPLTLSLLPSTQHPGRQVAMAIHAAEQQGEDRLCQADWHQPFCDLRGPQGNWPYHIHFLTLYMIEVLSTIIICWRLRGVNLCKLLHVTCKLINPVNSHDKSSCNRRTIAIVKWQQTHLATLLLGGGSCSSVPPQLVVLTTNHTRFLWQDKNITSKNTTSMLTARAMRAGEGSYQDHTSNTNTIWGIRAMVIVNM